MGRRVWYFYDSEIGNYSFGYGHPMKPQCVRMAHQMIVTYGLDKKMACYRPDKLVTAGEMTKFHADSYIDFLQRVNRENMDEYLLSLWRYNLGVETPLIDGLFEYCQTYTTGSISGAQKLNHKKADIVINWAGGMHHPRKAQSGGYTPVNDCVLAILELLRYHDRVLYVDIDFTHCDGVEETFYTSNRVMTLSFHKYDPDVFPGTGHEDDNGYGQGKGYALNIPLQDGIDDKNFGYISSTVIRAAVARYRPNAIVLQAGASCVSGDRLGSFNVSIEGYGSFIGFMRSLNIPMLVLGGSGYAAANTARCWTYATSILVGSSIPNEIPQHEYSSFYYPYNTLYFPTSNMENLNSQDYLEKMKEKFMINLSLGKAAPQIQSHLRTLKRRSLPSQHHRNERRPKHDSVCEISLREREIIEKDHHVQNNEIPAVSLDESIDQP